MPYLSQSHSFQPITRCVSLAKIQSFLLWTTPSRNLPCFLLSWLRCCPSLPPQHLWPHYLLCCDSPNSSYLSAHIMPHRGYLLLCVYSEVTSPQKHIPNTCGSPVTLSTATIKKTACGPSRLTVLILYLGYSHQGKGKMLWEIGVSRSSSNNSISAHSSQVTPCLRKPTCCLYLELFPFVKQKAFSFPRKGSQI